MRIGLITHNQYALTEPMYGGLEAFTYDIAMELRARGHDLTVFGVRGSSEKIKSLPCLSPGASAGLAHECEDFGLLAHHEYLQIMLTIDLYGLDVIFNNSLHYVPATMATSIATPMLTVLHTPPIPELREAYAYPNVGGYLCSPSHANARNWGGLISRCEVIPNAVDLQMWKPRGAKSDFAIWSGRIVPEKGLHLAIEAARMANIPLRIAGPISDPVYYQQCIQPRLGSGVTYLGHLARPALAAGVACASVALVTPCWEEPFGLVVAEAIASGTPVAGFNRGALSELVTPEVGVLVEPGDVSALAAAIPSAIGLSADCCRSLAQTRWAFSEQVSRYEIALAETARSRSRKSPIKSAPSYTDGFH
ncbi:glycosyltransferase [Pseudomonas sp. NPDC088368]|uniref:glycosyltransferase n=1 Tax=Pseudomonas sp. NPDC088368 TaxID=3364453 RepID=UPI0038018206